MVQSAARTPEEYLGEIEDDERRATVARLRDLVTAHIGDGFTEGMAWGMISWSIPMEVSGPTYNGQPLLGVALANQKRHVSIYLMAVYGDPELARSFEEAWTADGRTLDMGKSCVRVKRWEDVDEEALVEALEATTVDQVLGATDAR